MSAAAAPTAPAGAEAPKRGKKKLILIVVAVLLLVVLGGGGAMVYMKKKAAATADEGGDDSSTHASESHADKRDLKHPPTFVPLEPFVVNLTDRDTDRYAQVGVTFEVNDAHFGDEMKGFMPAIRNGILLIISHKSSRDLLDAGGKEKLADEILRDASATLGIEVEDPDDEADADNTDQHGAAADESPKPAKKKKKKKKRKAAEPNPIQHVHFSTFIVQ